MSSKEKLQKQIDKIDIVKKQRNTGVFTDWETRTISVIASIYGEGSKEVGRFKGISYSGSIFPRILSRKSFDEQDQEDYEKGLDQAKYFLQTLVDDLEEVDPVKEEKKKKQNVELDIRKMFDKELVELSKGLFDDEHYSNSVLEAMKLVNNKVKEIVKKNTGESFDGADLMNKAFSVKKPIIILGDLETETGQNIQQGYMDLFRGAMLAIRNPKAHDHVKLEKEKAIHFLFLANLLLMRLKEAGY
ncbi:MAG: TIGR02391 family protein [Candidatus Absconditabacterales bacterium]